MSISFDIQSYAVSFDLKDYFKKETVEKFVTILGYRAEDLKDEETYSEKVRHFSIKTSDNNSINIMLSKDSYEGVDIAEFLNSYVAKRPLVVIFMYKYELIFIKGSYAEKYLAKNKIYTMNLSKLSDRDTQFLGLITCSEFNTVKTARILSNYVLRNYFNSCREPNFYSNNLIVSILRDVNLKDSVENRHALEETFLFLADNYLGVDGVLSTENKLLGWYSLNYIKHFKLQSTIKDSAKSGKIGGIIINGEEDTTATTYKQGLIRILEYIARDNTLIDIRSYFDRIYTTNINKWGRFEAVDIRNYDTKPLTTLDSRSTPILIRKDIKSWENFYKYAISILAYFKIPFDSISILLE